MQYRQLGKWGIKVSEISLGSWTYGGLVGEKEACAQVRFAFDQGINLFDCANSYGHGQAEEVVGKALREIRRDSYAIATKVFFPMGEGANDRGLSRKHVFEQCHQSLKRLGVDYIDLYQCHRFDPEVPMYETVRAMDDLIRQGKILYWGVSEWWSEQIEEAVQTASSLNAMPPVSNQPQYNMIFRRIEENVMPTSEKLGLGQIVFSPLAQGVLAGRYKPGAPYPNDSRAAANKQDFILLGHDTLSCQSLEIVERLTSIANDANVTMAQLALSWCLRAANVASVITGATKKSQIEDNVKASGMKLGNDVWDKVESVLGARI
jgi:voltage-dependent potassium channel beta subunit